MSISGDTLDTPLLCAGYRQPEGVYDEMSAAPGILRPHWDALISAMSGLGVEELARKAGMSVAAFHHYFKLVTASSPLQYLKRIRLDQARRLMAHEGYNANTAARMPWLRRSRGRARPGE